MKKSFPSPSLLLFALALAGPVEAAVDMSGLKPESIGNAIVGPSTDEDRREIAATFQAIEDIIRRPDSIASLRTPGLQTGSCIALVDGPERCSYWAPVRAGEQVMVLRSLSIDSVRALGDHGGGAFWNVSETVCLSSQAVLDVARGKAREVAAPPGEAFGGEIRKVGKSRAYVLEDLNPAWGKARMRISVQDGCVVSLALELRRTD